MVKSETKRAQIKIKLDTIHPRKRDLGVSKYKRTFYYFMEQNLEFCINKFKTQMNHSKGDKYILVTCDDEGDQLRRSNLWKYCNFNHGHEQE